MDSACQVLRRLLFAAMRTLTLVVLFSLIPRSCAMPTTCGLYILLTRTQLTFQTNLQSRTISLGFCRWPLYTRCPDFFIHPHFHITNSLSSLLRPQIVLIFPVLKHRSIPRVETWAIAQPPLPAMLTQELRILLTTSQNRVDSVSLTQSNILHHSLPNSTNSTD